MDDQNEQDQNLKNILGFDPTSSDRTESREAQGKIPAEVIQAFGSIKDSDMFEQRRVPSSLLWIARQDDIVRREYNRWSRDPDSGKISFGVSTTLTVTEDSEMVEWPKDDQHGPSGTIEGNSVSIYYGGKVTATVMMDGDRAAKITWDPEGNLVVAEGCDNGLVVGNQRYDIPRKIDIPQIKDERLPSMLLKNAYDAPPEMDISWKTSGPLEFLGIKPAS